MSNFYAFDSKAKSCLEDIKLIYLNNKTPTLNAIHDCVHICYNLLDEDIVKDFLIDHLYYIVNNLVDQSPAKVGAYEKSRTEECLLKIVEILIKVLPNNGPYFYQCIFRLFDISAPFYAGVRTFYQQYQGFPNVKHDVMMKFTQLGGYTLLIDNVFKPKFLWCGSVLMTSFVRAMNHEEVLNALEKDVKIAFIESLMDGMLHLTDEQIKRDSSEQLILIIKIIGAMMTWHANNNKPIKKFILFYKFWFDFIIYLMSSSSLVLKLYAWDILNEYLNYAVENRPFPRSYQIDHAGIQDINGIYQFSRYEKGVPIYEKQSTNQRDVLCLQRFPMKDKTFRWYISICRPDQPDVDFYEDNNPSSDRRLPSTNDWVGSGTNSKFPPPVLTPVGYILQCGFTEDEILINNLPVWVVNSNLLSHVFNDSMHRENVSRSEQIVIFLAQQKVINCDHLNMIWKFALNATSDDISDEIWIILAKLLCHIDRSLFQIIVDLVATELKKDDKSIVKIATFLEKVSIDIDKYIHTIEKNDCDILLLQLVWDVYKSKNFNTIKNSATIQDLLTKCLQLPCGNQFLLSHINDALSQLQSVCLTTDKSKAVDEMIVDNIIQNLLFLTSKTADKSLLMMFDGKQYIDAIIDEIERFVQSHDSNSCESTFYINGLKSRLSIIRRFYGLSEDVNITDANLQRLWTLLSKKFIDLEEFFVFLHNGIMNNASEESCSFCDGDVCIYIFENFICNVCVNWSNPHQAGFNCFHNYFELLFHKDYVVMTAQGKSQLRDLGLSTLWTIVLNIPSDNDLNRFAENLLLLTYDEIVRDDPEVYESLVSILFEKLSSSSISSIERCINILHQAIIKSKCTMEISHALHGFKSNIAVRIEYRRVNVFYNHMTRSDILSTVKGSEGNHFLDINPLQTVGHLKERLSDVLNFTDTCAITVTYHKRTLNDDERLIHAGVGDGSDVYVVYRNPSVSVTNHNKRPTTTNYSSSFHQDIGYIIANDDKKFQLVVNLATSLAASKAHVGLSQRLWEVLMLIPTKYDIWNQILNSYSSDSNDENSIKAWLQGVTVESIQTNIAYLTYCMQIIDHSLQPLLDSDRSHIFSLQKFDEFREAFMQHGGLKVITNIFLSAPVGVNYLFQELSSTLIHIIQYLLFSQDAVIVSSNEHDFDNSEISAQSCGDVMTSLLAEKESHVIQNIIHIANAALSSTAGDINVISTTFSILSVFLQSSQSIAQSLVDFPQTKHLLTNVLRNDSSRIREVARSFTIDLGLHKAEVFEWLVEQLSSLNRDDRKCDVIFKIISDLLVQSRMIFESHFASLAQLLSDKLLSYRSRSMEDVIPCDSSSTSSDSDLGGEFDLSNDVLLGYLDLLAKLLRLDVDCVMKTNLGQDLVHFLWNDFLFTLSEKDNKLDDPICGDSIVLRQAALQVLLAYLSTDPTGIQHVFTLLQGLTEQAVPFIARKWDLMLSFDVRKPSIPFLGLKNQGCTCYSNSSLQQLFMNKPFREAILNAPIASNLRSSLWFKSDQELIGCKILVEWKNGKWHRAIVREFTSQTSSHTIEYTDPSFVDGDKVVILNLHTGRRDYETGRVRLDTPSDNNNTEVTERQQAAIVVLEQLQRAFCYLQYSKKRYFDPRRLVDACKTLNLNFDVYHQNDAAEFCDQLLDRIEMATKAHPAINSNLDIWGEIFKSSVFGGEFTTQKIPKDCVNFQQDKNQCGHWQSSRKESFLKIELIIRNKSTVHESLSELIQGELMDGDNKIQCDVCQEKKATTRRTCVDSLPNTLIVHLKRFDLDYQTFETVKLNSRMEFPMILNMFDYTKTGIAAKEEQQQAAELLDDGVGNTSEYEYELQGVLVHAGIAQGGHYYSIIKDAESDDRWFKFDDDDVTQFPADQISYECYGGSSSGHSDDAERTSNALMLFYVKKCKQETANSDLSNKLIETSTLINGYQAYMREVTESNLRHALTCYILDSQMHDFVRDTLLLGVEQLSVAQKTQISEFGIRFYLNVVLHCRERSNMKAWLSLFQTLFESDVALAYNFLYEASMGRSYYETTLFEYLFICQDINARSNFVQLLVYAVQALYNAANVDKLVKLFTALHSEKFVSIHQIMASLSCQGGSRDIESLLVVLLKMIIDYVYTVPLYVRTADEYFVLIRDLSLISTFRSLLMMDDFIVKLCYFIIPDCVNQDIRGSFHLPTVQQQQSSQSFTMNANGYYGPSSSPNSTTQYRVLHGAIYEAIASLIGVPQMKKVALLEESKSYWDRNLVPEAKDGLTWIYHQVAGNANSIDMLQVSKFIEAVMGAKPNQHTLMHMMQQSTSNDNRLNLEGFLQYYTDRASYASKEIWMILQHYGYRNDLTRNASFTIVPGSSTPFIAWEDSPQLALSGYAQLCLMNLSLFEIGYEVNEEVIKPILQRVCWKEEKISCRLIALLLKRLLEETQSSRWDSKTESLLELLSIVLKLDDDINLKRISVVLMNRETGLLQVIDHQKKFPSPMDNNGWSKTGNWNNTSNSVLSKYINYVQMLSRQIPVFEVQVSSYLDAEPSLADIQSLFHSPSSSEHTAVSLAEIDDDDSNQRRLNNSVLTILGSGIQEANGEYSFVSMLNGAVYYNKYTMYHGQMVTFAVYKCATTDNSYQWYLSIPPQGQSPGTKNDIDFYFAHGEAADRYPPTSTWQACGDNPPSGTPTITISFPQFDTSIPMLKGNVLQSRVYPGMGPNSPLDVESLDSDETNDTNGRHYEVDDMDELEFQRQISMNDSGLSDDLNYDQDMSLDDMGIDEDGANSPKST